MYEIDPKQNEVRSSITVDIINLYENCILKMQCQLLKIAKGEASP
jgi:hypothetical protein